MSDGKNRTYQPMDKRGAIILATGGDNSNGAMGKFYEGYMVTGVTSDETDAAVQVINMLKCHCRMVAGGRNRICDLPAKCQCIWTEESRRRYCWLCRRRTSSLWGTSVGRKAAGFHPRRRRRRPL